MMRQISTIIKSMIFLTIMGTYMFSGSSLAGGTCGIGYVKGLKLWTVQQGDSDNWLPTVAVFIDNTGFVSPSITNTNTSWFGGTSIPAISIARGTDHEMLGYHFDMLKMAQAARIPVRIYYRNDDNLCKGVTGTFIITLCTHEHDCNFQ